MPTQHFRRDFGQTPVRFGHAREDEALEGAVAEPDTEQLLAQVAAGDASARDRLLALNRSRLKRMVAVRMDPRLAARVDPSDVVQEALTDATRKWDRYLRDRPLPFYPWLRRLAWERLVKLYRRHVLAQRRSVDREERRMRLPDQSALQLARRIAGSTTGPSAQLRRNELRDHVRDALAKMRPADRELLVLRHLEGMTAKEIAAVLEKSEGAVNTRHVRALCRLRKLMDSYLGEAES
jgi:RNA polymerase sigma-70 factor, ECF subfamily